MVFGNPLRWHMVRRVGGTRGKVDKKWLIWRQRLLIMHPIDRLIGHVRHEVIAGRARRLDAGDPVKEARCPLVGLAAEKAIKLVKAGAGRPAVCRSGRTDFPGRGFVRLAKHRRAITVKAQDFGERGDQGDCI